MTDIPGYATFSKIEPVDKGMSSDKKYRVETSDGQRMFLRVSDISELDTKKAEYDLMERVYGLGVLTPRPLGFGLCRGGKSCYSLYDWLDGEDAEKALMSETEQYVLGLKAGQSLRKIHTLPAPEGIDDWMGRYFGVIGERIDAYRSEGVPFAGSGTILKYLERNRNLLRDRPQCCLHGDFHEGNLMVGNGGDLYITDFLDEGFGNHGDPWYDFKTFGENENAYFSTGYVRGYFNGEPPPEFWDVLTYYVVTAALTSIVWMKYHNPDGLSEAVRWNERNARSVQEGHSPLMKWYLKDFYIQYIDGVPLRLKKPFDLSFLHKYGTVFKVFDAQDSGNLCFGIANGDKRYFVKYAGAPAERSCVSAEEAAANLKRAVPVYKDLAHPNLIKFIDGEEIGGGFAMIFDWVDAECPHPMYPLSREKFMRMPTEKRVEVFEDILAFHAHAAAKNYVAVDFYDGSILYDFVNGKTVVCDIDFYAKAPYINQMGRLWGSSRFMSPEEFTPGAVIDEITNVYTMGAAAFALFSDSDRSPQKWPLDERLYAVVKRAVNDERGERQQSIAGLIEEWNAAKR